MSTRPSGTVTLLFTDIEGSTGLVDRLGAAYGELLERKRSLIRKAIHASGGFEVDCRGDEFFVAFQRPQDGVAAAVSAQHALHGEEWPPEARVRVRMGLHMGEPVLSRERDYLGLDVHRAARICSAGHGGQILLSETVRAELNGVDVIDLGAHELPGLPEAERLYQLRVPGLPSEFPPLRATKATTGGTRVAIADDSVLLREGIARLLEETGFQVVGQAGSAEELIHLVRNHEPHVAITDIRMPPTNTDEGIQVAKKIRSEHPDVGVLLLSQYVEEEYAHELLSGDTRGLGYLLKDRVADVDEFASAVRRIAEGGTVLDPALE